MRFLSEVSRARMGKRLALVMISAGVAGCSADVARFERTPFPAAQSNVPPSEVTGTVRAAPAAPVGRVDSQPLPPSQASAALPPPPQRSYGAPAAPRPERPATASYPAAPTPQRSGASPSRQSGVHVVAPRETLITIARAYGKSRQDLARANGISPDARLRIGQRLVIPGVPQAKIRVAASTAAAAPAPHATPKPAPASAANPAKPQAQPAAPAKRLAATQLGAPPSNLKPPAERVEKARIATPAADAAVAAKEEQPATTGAVASFRWPVRGRVIAGFGPKPNGQQNDGINLAVPEGTSVKAAEDGVVAYAGNELKGYGNLVLVRHANGYVTAYAHASELKVKRGDTVKRGQIIALAGQTGGVSSPQLHFEIRKGSKPVDPLPHLSGH